MFWETFEHLCQQHGSTPTAISQEIGFSNATATKWKKGSIPNGETLQKIADYFNVSVDYLLGKEDKKIPLGRIIEREEDMLWAKICRLSAENRNKVDGYVTALLDEQHREETAKTKNA